MRISCSEGVQRLRGKSVEQGIDRIRKGGLDAGIRLKAKPGGVLFVDVVIDSNRLDLFMIIARMRDALPIGATDAIIDYCRWNTTHIERTAEHHEKRSARISIQRKHLLIERHRLW